MHVEYNGQSALQYAHGSKLINDINFLTLWVVLLFKKIQSSLVLIRILRGAYFANFR